MSGSKPNLSVEIALAGESQRGVLKQLLQLYLHDFSEFADIGSPHGELRDDGRFSYPYFASYWTEADRIPLITRVNGKLAGFAFINHHFVSDPPSDHALAEFFVVRKYRRAGIGTAAARQLFARFRGRWEVPVAAYNLPALVFWRKAVGGAREIADLEERAGDGERWTGTILRFATSQNAQLG